MMFPNESMLSFNSNQDTIEVKLKYLPNIETI
jgi:hypothetical protein